MKEKLKVSIIIPVYNQWEYTKACLQALFVNPPSMPHEIVIVDNASNDATEKELKVLGEKHANLKVFRLPTNSGFSPACNYGAEVSQGELLLFLNNDTIPQPGWLEILVSEIQSPEVGMVAPKLLYPDGKRINHAGYAFNFRIGSFYSIYNEDPADSPAVNKKRAMQALLGACILIRRKTFFELGKFALYGLEDIDLCLKVQNLGLKCIYCPQSVVYHHGSVTLRLSDPKFVPQTSFTEFAEAWKQVGFIWDDYKYYMEDGIRPAPEAKDGLTSKQILDRSYLHVSHALHHLADKNIQAANSSLDSALKDWQGNIDAWCIKLHILDTQGKVEELLIQSREMIANTPYYADGTIDMLNRLKRHLTKDQMVYILDAALESAPLTPLQKIPIVQLRQELSA